MSMCHVENASLMSDCTLEMITRCPLVLAGRVTQYTRVGDSEKRRQMSNTVRVSRRSSLM